MAWNEAPSPRRKSTATATPRNLKTTAPVSYSTLPLVLPTGEVAALTAAAVAEALSLDRHKAVPNHEPSPGVASAGLRDFPPTQKFISSPYIFVPALLYSVP
jgi:hypothetical protein